MSLSYYIPDIRFAISGNFLKNGGFGGKFWVVFGGDVRFWADTDDFVRTNAQVW